MESLGILIAIGGWVVLLFFAGEDAGTRFQVVNLHRLQIANNIIHLGYFIIVCGLALRALKHLGVTLLPDAQKPPHATDGLLQKKAASTEETKTEMASTLSEDFKKSSLNGMANSDSEEIERKRKAARRTKQRLF